MFLSTATGLIILSNPCSDFLKVLFCCWYSDVLDIMSWCEDNLPAGSFWQDWTPFEHPQLGHVEIGGWKWKELSQNPPAVMLGCVVYHC